MYQYIVWIVHAAKVRAIALYQQVIFAELKYSSMRRNYGTVRVQPYVAAVPYHML